MRLLMFVGMFMAVLGCIVLLVAGSVLGWHSATPTWLDATLATLFGGGLLLALVGITVTLWREGR